LGIKAREGKGKKTIRTSWSVAVLKNLGGRRKQGEGFLTRERLRRDVSRTGAEATEGMLLGPGGVELNKRRTVATKSPPKPKSEKRGEHRARDVRQRWERRTVRDNDVP